MLSKPTTISWWESNSASLHQTQGASTCYASIPFEAVYNTPPNDSQIEWLYHYFTRELADCIDSQGYAIPNNAPSFSQFREAMTGNGSEYWSPYVELPTLTPAETQTLRDVCVEYPDEYYGR